MYNYKPFAHQPLSNTNFGSHEANPATHRLSLNHLLAKNTNLSRLVSNQSALLLSYSYNTVGQKPAPTRFSYVRCCHNSTMTRHFLVSSL